MKYYLHLFEIAKSSLDINGETKLTENKLNVYDDIMKSLQMMPEEKKIYINLDNGKKITLDLGTVDLKTVEWSKIIPNFENVLKSTLILSGYEEYIYKKIVNRLGIMNIKE